MSEHALDLAQTRALLGWKNTFDAGMCTWTGTNNLRTSGTVVLTAELGAWQRAGYGCSKSDVTIRFSHPGSSTDIHMIWQERLAGAT